MRNPAILFLLERTMERIRVMLSEEEFAALMRLCDAEVRNPSDQMRHLLREALQRRNALPAISDSGEESKRDA